MIAHAAFYQSYKKYLGSFFPQRFSKHVVKTQIYLLNLEKKNLLRALCDEMKPKGKKKEQLTVRSAPCGL